MIRKTQTVALAFVFSFVLLLRLQPPGVAIGTDGIGQKAKPAQTKVESSSRSLTSISSIPYPDPKWRRFKIPFNEQSLHYCWLDSTTTLWVLHSQGRDSQFKTLPVSSKFDALIKSLKDAIPNRESRLSLQSLGSGRYVALHTSRYYYLFDHKGNPGSSGSDYHTDTYWSPAATSSISAWHGTNGNLKDFPTVSFGQLDSSSKGTHIANSARNPLFVAGFQIAAAMSRSKLYSINRPYANNPLRVVPNKRREIWMLERNLKNLNGQSRKRIRTLPFEGEVQETLFSPDGEKFAILLQTNQKTGAGLILTGHSRSLKLRGLVRFTTGADDMVRQISWQPNSKALSFIFEDWLYLMPVE